LPPDGGFTGAGQADEGAKHQASNLSGPGTSKPKASNTWATANQVYDHDLVIGGVHGKKTKR